MTSQQQAKNKRRLVLQNKKLHKEIYLLNQQFKLLMQKDQQIANKLKGQINPQLQSKISELQAQQKYIKMLKTKISYLNSTNAKVNSMYIHNQQNDLIYLKRELANLQEQKELIMKQKAEKMKSLLQNEPLSQHKSEILEKFNKVKKQNRQSTNNITELQRQIRKYHEIVQLSKLPHDSVENPQILLITAQHQIKQTHKTISDMTEKWRVTFQTLDKQFLQFREQYHKKQQTYNELQRQYKAIDLKIGAIRQQSDVLNDRARVSSVPQLKQQQKFSSFLAKQSPKKKLRTPSLQNKKVPVFRTPRKRISEQNKESQLVKQQVNSSLQLQQKSFKGNKTTIPVLEKNLLKKIPIDKNVSKIIKNDEVVEKKVKQITLDKSKSKKIIQEVSKGVSANFKPQNGKISNKNIQKVTKNTNTKSERPAMKVGQTNSQISFKSSQKVKVREVQYKKKLLKNVGVGPL